MVYPGKTSPREALRGPLEICGFGSEKQTMGITKASHAVVQYFHHGKLDEIEKLTEAVT